MIYPDFIFPFKTKICGLCIGMVTISVLTGASDKVANTYNIYGYAQGTSYHITYVAQKDELSGKQVDHVLATLDSSLSAYKRYSLVSRFNNADNGVEMDEHLRTVVLKAREISQSTEGAFDIFIKPVAEAWKKAKDPAVELPDSLLIKNLMGCTGNNNIIVRGKWLLKKDPCVQIDVDGIAQGYSVDILAGELEKRGVQNYLVELGGEISVRGKKLNGTPFTIGLERPNGNTYEIHQLLQPGEGALTTSGSYRNFFSKKGKKISHLIDGRTGFPVDNEMISATVWAKEAIIADALDNAFMAMGVNKALEFTRKQEGVEAYFIYKNEEDSVVIEATAGFDRMITHD